LIACAPCPPVACAGTLTVTFVSASGARAHTRAGHGRRHGFTCLSAAAGRTAWADVRDAGVRAGRGDGGVGRLRAHVAGRREVGRAKRVHPARSRANTEVGSGWVGEEAWGGVDGPSEAPAPGRASPATPSSTFARVNMARWQSPTRHRGARKRARAIWRTTSPVPESTQTRFRARRRVRSSSRLWSVWTGTRHGDANCVDCETGASPARCRARRGAGANWNQLATAPARGVRSPSMLR
jgi:hypothetical protein